MYNKLFAKILDSSIWLEPTTTRIVWVTMLAAMDEDGFAQFASVANVAHRAIVTVPEAEAALAALEGPDPNSSDPANDGRRLERVPGGWMVLNAEKYKDLVTRDRMRERVRERVRKHRAGRVTPCNGAKQLVTPSYSDTDTEKDVRTARSDRARREGTPEGFDAFWASYPKHVARAKAEKAYAALNPDAALQAKMLAALEAQKGSDQWTRDGGAFIPHPTTWLHGRRWEDELAPTVAHAGSARPMPAYPDADWCWHDPRCPSREYHAVRERDEVEA